MKRALTSYAILFALLTPAMATETGELPEFCKVYNRLKKPMQELLIKTLPRTGKDQIIKLIVDGKRMNFMLTDNDIEGLPLICTRSTIAHSPYGGVQD
jgi:hypothetical protein